MAEASTRMLKLAAFDCGNAQIQLLRAPFWAMIKHSIFP